MNIIKRLAWCLPLCIGAANADITDLRISTEDIDGRPALRVEAQSSNLSIRSIDPRRVMPDIVRSKDVSYPEGLPSDTLLWKWSENRLKRRWNFSASQLFGVYRTEDDSLLGWVDFGMMPTKVNTGDGAGYDPVAHRDIVAQWKELGVVGDDNHQIENKGLASFLPIVPATADPDLVKEAFALSVDMWRFLAPKFPLLKSAATTLLSPEDMPVDIGLRTAGINLATQRALVQMNGGDTAPVSMRDALAAAEAEFQRRAEGTDMDPETVTMPGESDRFAAHLMGLFGRDDPKLGPLETAGFRLVRNDGFKEFYSTPDEIKHRDMAIASLVPAISGGAAASDES